VLPAFDPLLVQLKGFGATVALSAVGTLAICFLTDKTVGFRIDQQGEPDGLDIFLHSENGYGLIFPESR
jgi:Amt family ammonium transporter